MVEFKTRGKVVQVPQSVDELTSEQYLYFCSLALALDGETIDAEYFRIRWLSYLLGMGKTDYTMLLPKLIEEIESQAGAIDGFFSESDGRKVLDFFTCRNLLPEYKGYRGPGDFLDGVPFGIFVECLTVLESVRRDPESADESYRHIARKLYNIPEEDRVPLMLAFHAPLLLSSVWRAIQEGPIDINGSKIDFRIIFKASGSSRPDDKTGWTGITFEVASAGLFGNVAEVEKTDMWAVLLYLYRCKFEYLNDKRSAPAK